MKIRSGIRENFLLGARISLCLCLSFSGSEELWRINRANVRGIKIFFLLTVGLFRIGSKECLISIRESD